MSDSNLPDWERVLSAASRLQQILPVAVLVGGTAAAVYADAGLAEYKNLAARWHQWSNIKAACAKLAELIFDKIITT